MIGLKRIAVVCLALVSFGAALIGQGATPGRPAADRSKATVRVRVGFKQKDPRILPDMGVKVSFLSG